jgi:hypothetical protein
MAKVAWDLLKVIDDGVRVEKPTESYVAAIDRHGPLCTCADWEFRHNNNIRDPLCKHLKALVEHKLIDWPPDTVRRHELEVRSDD